MALAIEFNKVCYWLLTDQVVIGRSGNSGIVVENNLASRHHCRLRRTLGHLYVADLQSSNGTFVNGSRLKGERRLAAGDRIQIGRAELVVVEVPDGTHSEPALPRAHRGENDAEPTAHQWSEEKAG